MAEAIRSALEALHLEVFFPVLVLMISSFALGAYWIVAVRKVSDIEKYIKAHQEEYAKGMKRLEELENISKSLERMIQTHDNEIKVLRSDRHDQSGQITEHGFRLLALEKGSQILEKELGEANERLEDEIRDVRNKLD